MNEWKPVKGTILVVDDAPVIRNIIKMALQEEFNVLEAENGEEALNELERVNYNIDGMFLDIIMPKSNGYVVLDTFKSRHISIPITVISGDDSMDTIQTVCNTYKVEYINKPLSKDKIVSIANGMLKHNLTQFTTNENKE